MKHTPINLQDLDLQSDRQHCNTTTIRPLPLIDNYTHFYRYPDFNFDPYWGIQIYNQHHLLFYNTFLKNTSNIEPDAHDIDQNLNTVLTKAFVESWQSKWAATSPATHEESMKEFYQHVPVVTLTATLEERFVNTLISLDGEPDYIPLTTKLGLKYKRRLLYFPMDFGELTLDSLVDTGALSSAIPGVDPRKIR